MAEASYAYVAGGSGHDETAADNRAAFAQWSIVPRLLRPVSDGHTRISLGAVTLAHPVLLAPVAFQRLAHDAAEIATARAAAATDTCMVCSTLATRTLEDIARNAGQHKWFQLYLQPSRDATRALLAKAEQAGFGAIVVTLDASIQVASLSALRAGFRMPADCVAVNLALLAQPMPPLAPDASPIFQGTMAAAPNWQDLEWLLTQTHLPVWVKGVLHPDDAVALQAAGIDGVIVSNHGGRTLDSVPSSLSMLAAIRSAVGPNYPVLLDGGIRRGADIFKALALGADAVLVGRLQMYALSVAGALGVAHMLKLLREELEICMAMAGCATVDDIDAACLQPHYSRL